jgi:hypothetical protein
MMTRFTTATLILTLAMMTSAGAQESGNSTATPPEDATRKVSESTPQTPQTEESPDAFDRGQSDYTEKDGGFSSEPYTSPYGGGFN